MNVVRSFLRWVLALFFIAAGTNHFRVPEVYLGMMPSWVPSPSLVNSIVGMAEFAGGLGLIFAPTRRLAGWCLILLLIAVFPANVHVALLGKTPGYDVPAFVLWLRLPLQAVLIAWTWWTAVMRTRHEERVGHWSSH